MTSRNGQHERLDTNTASRIDSERVAREKVREGSPELFASVSAILFECDPIGINFEDNTDEYDIETGSIIPRLPERSSETETRKMIHAEFTKWFSDTAGGESRYSECAHKIWELWQTQQRQP